MNNKTKAIIEAVKAVYAVDKKLAVKVALQVEDFSVEQLIKHTPFLLAKGRALLIRNTRKAVEEIVGYEINPYWLLDGASLSDMGEFVYNILHHGYAYNGNYTYYVTIDGEVREHYSPNYW